MTCFRITAATLAILVGTALPLAPGHAHHSFAMFDQAKITTVTGTVKEFNWVNPHVVLWVYAAAKEGETPELWTIELTSPGNLTRLGWSRQSLKAGDRVAVEVNPLRDGQHGGGFRKATLLDNGQVLQANLINIEKAAAGTH